MSKLLREPLLHFLAIGLGLFVFYEFVADDNGTYDPRVIEVNRDTLLTFMQYRSRAFEPDIAVRRLNNMTNADFERLIADYVREEALHREALALGMEKNDYIIKRRLIQSIEFITAGFATAGLELTDNDIAAYYEANRQSYFVEPFVTFTHVFFSNSNRDRNDALALSTAKLAELNAQNVPFAGAPLHGDPFPYARNYVEREQAFVASHFGEQTAEAIFGINAGETLWQGPFESPYGFHVVLLAQKAEGRFPSIEEIQNTVRDDAERDAVKAQKDKAIQTIVDTYEIRTDLQRPLASLKK